MPQESNPEVGLLLIGASAVEIFSHATPEHAALYQEGEGRYLVSLAEPRTEACNQALINRGYDPNTLAFNPESPDALFTYDLDACFTAERVGPMQDYYNPEEITLTSRYIFRVESVLDPRGDENRPIGRGAYQIVDRETNEVIAERIVFSGNAGHYSIECPDMNRRWLEVYPWDVFAARE